VGLILDSSVAIAAERRRHTVEQLIQYIIDAAGDQDAALSAIGVAELVHGIFRADTDERRRRRESFIEELLSVVSVYPFTIEAARLAGRLDAEQQSRGIIIPFADLLIGATALSVGYAVATVNRRHFGQIPGLSVVEL
jgi:predicted nucleic acid-binding protein